MDRLDYEKLGLMVGLEIHQQLDTSRKLFCRCPTRMVDEEGGVFERTLRPTQSELGEVDVAAYFEWRRRRRYRYQSPRVSTCLVEDDEEPPHEISREAVAIALAVAKALGAKPVDEIHVMRKIVIDGSNTTGFQRTAIVAMGGSLEDEDGRVRIQTICVEEDAARKMEEKGRTVVYRLDRLGIPLIEIATGPDIHTPEQAQRVALKIGQILRLTGKAKRGLGTIRQDLNVSIRGGTKTEIKGVQKLELIAKVVEYEALRQLRLLEIRDELGKRGVTEEMLDNPIVDLTEIFTNTKSKVIRRALSSGGKVLGIKLPGFAGLLGRELQPGRRFGTELADYARFWGGVGGLFHSDELPAYGITGEEVAKVREALGVGDNDAFILVADREEKVREALKAVVERAKWALRGIPPETRAASPDGTTRYMRPQPGAARMYPETDTPPLEVDEELLKEAEKYVPEPPEVKLKRFTEEHGLSKDLAEQVLRDIRLDLYEHLVDRYGGQVPPTVIASTITSTLKALRGEGVPVENLEDHHIEEAIALVAKGAVAKEAIPEILAYLAENPEARAEEAAEKLGLTKLTPQQVEEMVSKIVEENRQAILERGERAMGLIMGRAMAVLRGKADGKLVAKIVREKIAKVLGKD